MLLPGNELQGHGFHKETALNVHFGWPMAKDCFSSYSDQMEVFLKELVPYLLGSGLKLWPQYLPTAGIRA